MKSTSLRICLCTDPSCFIALNAVFDGCRLVRLIKIHLGCLSVMTQFSHLSLKQQSHCSPSKALSLSPNSYDSATHFLVSPAEEPSFFASAVDMSAGKSPTGYLALSANVVNQGFGIRSERHTFSLLLTHDSRLRLLCALEFSARLLE